LIKKSIQKTLQKGKISIGEKQLSARNGLFSQKWLVQPEMAYSARNG
jgi:hypothetical protein